MFFRITDKVKRSLHFFCGSETPYDGTWNNPYNIRVFIRSYALTILVFSFLYSYLGGWSVGEEIEDIGGFESIYFSVVTITTLGYGDISPETNFQMFLVSSEVLIGIFLFGFFLQRIGKEWADTQHRTYLAQEQARRDCELMPTFANMLRSLELLTSFFDSRQAQNFHPYHSDMLRFGDQIVSVGRSYFKPADYVINLETRGNLPLSDLTPWWSNVVKCKIAIYESGKKAPITLTEQIFVEHMRDFNKLSNDVSSNLRHSPTNLDGNTVHDWATRVELLIKEAYLFKSFLRSKADEAWAVDDRYRGHSENHRIARKHDKYMQQTAEEKGREVGIIFLKIKRKLQNK